MSNDGIKLELRGKTFKTDFIQIIGGLAESLAKTFIAVKTGGGALAVTPNLITGLFGALKGIKLEETNEFRAWLLISGGLLFSFEKCVPEMELSRVPSPEDFNQLMKNLATRIETRTYTVEPDFFAAPNSLKLLDDVSHELSAWSSNFGRTQMPGDCRSKIEKHFLAGLHRTWTKGAGRFLSLQQALNSPFTPYLKIQQEIDGYLQFVEEQFTELRLIGQDEDDPKAVTLAQVFVQLRAYIEEGDFSQERDFLRELDVPTSNIDPSRKETKKRVVRFFETLDGWIQVSDRRDALRIVSGGPGIGKSSSMRAFAARTARSGSVYPILVPLQKLEKPDSPLRDRIGDYLVNTKNIPFSSSPLESVNLFRKPVLLIFDGLDELVRPGKDADEIAREFMVDLRGLLDQENGLSGKGPVRILAVTTGRIAAAGSAARALKCSGKQILFLLPFAEIDRSAERPHPFDRPASNFIDDESLLEEDQRITWWKLWKATGKGVPENMPKTLLHRDLFDITIEPLLLYFVALIRPWEAHPRKGGIVRNWLYDRLLHHFYDRECGKGDRNFATEFQSFEDYEIVLQAMAFAAWYDGSTRTGTIDIVEKLLRDWDFHVAASFARIVGANKPAIGAALAFYMKPGERPNSFEFLHKTFAEYLVARRTVQFVSSIGVAFEVAKIGRGGRSKVFDEGAQLRDWLRLMGPRPIDFDLLRFLRDEIALVHVRDPKIVLFWREVLTFCLRANLRDGMPAHLMFQLPDDQLIRRPQSFRDAAEQAKNAEEALLAALNSTILPSLLEPDFVAVDIRPPVHDRTLIGNMIHRLRGQRTHGNVLALTLFSGIDFSHEVLHLQDLYNLVAVNANFSSAELFMAILTRADLTGAKLDGAQLSDAVLESARLPKDQLSDQQRKRLHHHTTASDTQNSAPPKRNPKRKA